MFEASEAKTELGAYFFELPLTLMSIGLPILLLSLRNSKQGNSQKY